MSDPLKGVVEQVRQIADATARAVAGIATGTVLSRNPDGSVNVDSGDGGCARLANVSNQEIQCGSQVILGTEPAIGSTQTVCPVSVTISSSTLPCPIDDRTDENEEEEEVVSSEYVFVDDDGNRYASTGAFIETGGDTADTDASYGYEDDFGVSNEEYAGASPTYDDWLIGDLDDDSGYQGPKDHVRATRLAPGLGVSAGVLLGLEIKNVGGGADDNWTVQIRNITTGAIIATNPATYITDWVTDHIPDYFDPPDELAWDYHISADANGSFWIFLARGTDAGNLTFPLWNVSGTDGSQIALVEIVGVDQFLKRVKKLLL